MQTVAIPAPADPEAGHSPRQGSRPLLAALVAAVVAVLAHLVGMQRAAIYPFGQRPWAVNDALNQLLPHKAYLRGLLTEPGGPDSVLFNWHSALGMPYLGDFATYSTSPFNLLLVLVPESRLTLGALAISLLQVATAAAAMALVLLALHRSAPWGVAAALGAAYASCGWVTGDAVVVLSWLDGLVAFPVLLWAALRLLRRRHPIVSVLLVGVCWTANYYTAVMATLGVGLVVVTLLVVERAGWREALAGLGRVVGGFALGIATIAWLALPVLDAVRGAAQVPDTELYQVGWDTLLARLYPGNWTLGSGGLFVGLGTLALVAAAPWNRRLDVRSRLALVGLPVLAVVSMQVPATQLLWHSLAVPNGSAYRQAFVIAGILAVTAWVGLSQGLPGRWPLLGGTVTVALGALALWGPLTRSTLLLTAASLAVIAGAALLGRERLVALALVGTVLVEGAYTAQVTYRDKAEVHRAPTTLSASTLAERLAAVPQVDDGGRARVGHLTENDPLLFGYAGVDYYSSTVPQVATDAFAELGVHYSRRRIAFTGADPAAQVLLGVHDTAEDRVNAPVTVLPPGSVASDPAAAGTVWASRDELAGTRLYAVPSLQLDVQTDTVALTGSCRPGELLQVVTRAQDPSLVRTLTWAGETRTWSVPRVHTLGQVPADGRFTVTLGGEQLDVRPGDVGCLDTTALAGVVEASRAQQATVEFGPSRLTVSWPTEQTGEAVLLTTALPGWGCRTDAGPLEVGERAGMLAVPVDGASEVSCRYRTRGLWPGVAVAGGALALAVVLPLLRTRRRR